MMQQYANSVFAVLLLAFPYLGMRNSLTVFPSASSCDHPANAIVAENCKEGTSDWHIDRIQGDIEGFVSATSVAPGGKLDFFINTSAKQFNLSIYRSGYYGGKGGRLVYTTDLQGQAQPACQSNHALGLVNCGNWSKSYSLGIPKDWVSGVYLAKVVRPDTRGENYMVFVVREGYPKSDIVMQLSVTTYQAYNFYGNKALYSSLSFDYCPTVTNAPRAVTVSFDRPSSLGFLAENTYFWTDFPMVYWLEAQGYDTGYITDVDTHRFGTAGNVNELLDHRVFLSVGHDEYWTQEMRTAVAAARDHGVHLGFFSSNVSYWRIRFEPNPLTGQPDRLETTYKTTESGIPDPSGIPTTTWRDPAGANDPENSLVGIQYVGDNDVRYFPLQVSTEQARDPLYRNTGLQNMEPGTFAKIGKHLIGWEWDAATDNGRQPATLRILAESPTVGSILADAGRQYNYGTAHADVSRYTTPAGTIVFAAGTNYWSWGLAIYEPNPVIQQITYNLFSDMGVQPASPASTLILDGKGAPPQGRQDFVARDSSLRSEIESFMRIWEVPDFALATDVESPYVILKSTDSVMPRVSNIQVRPGSDSAVISWDTDQPTIGQVWLGFYSGPVDWSVTTEAVGAKPIAAEAVSEKPLSHHEFTLSGLLPNTSYFFHVAATGASGQSVVSAEGSFGTQASGSISLQAKRYLRPTFRQIKCGWDDRQWTFVGLGGLCILIVGGLGWYRRHTQVH
jgi:hypothetical protein